MSEPLQAYASLSENVIAFRDLVKRMRAAQQAYFRDRSSNNLIEAKQLERAVDATIKRMEQPNG